MFGCSLMRLEVPEMPGTEPVPAQRAVPAMREGEPEGAETERSESELLLVVAASQEVALR
jgi:hypothetical protein